MRTRSVFMSRQGRHVNGQDPHIIRQGPLNTCSDEGLPLNYPHCDVRIVRLSKNCKITVESCSSQPLKSRNTKLDKMAPNTGLPTIHRLITTHNDKGEAIFSDAVASETPQTEVGGGAIFGLHYCSESFPVEMNQDKDIQAYQTYMNQAPGLVISSGTVLRTVGEFCVPYSQL